MSLFGLSHGFVYLLYFCPSWDKSKDRSKINKQGRGWARKGHGIGVIVILQLIISKLNDDDMLSTLCLISYKKKGSVCFFVWTRCCTMLCVCHQHRRCSVCMYFVGLVGAIAPWIFIHGTDKVERGLMELFFGFVFPLPPSGNFFADALGCATTTGRPLGSKVDMLKNVMLEKNIPRQRNLQLSSANNLQALQKSEIIVIK